MCFLIAPIHLLCTPPSHHLAETLLLMAPNILLNPDDPSRTQVEDTRVSLPFVIVLLIAVYQPRDIDESTALPSHRCHFASFEHLLPVSDRQPCAQLTCEWTSSVDTITCALQNYCNSYLSRHRTVKSSECFLKSRACSPPTRSSIHALTHCRAM